MTVTGSASDASGWTVDTLLTHFTALLAEADRRQGVALAAHETLDLDHHKATEAALDKASAALDKRLDGMNQFRDQLREQSGAFLLRAEYSLAHEALRAEMVASVKTATSQINRNTEDITTMKGKGLGLNAGWGYLVGVLGIVASVIAVAIALSR